MDHMTRIPAGHGRWECRHGFLLTQCRCIRNHGVTVVPCSEIPDHELMMVEAGLDNPPTEHRRAAPVEPCGDSNPWQYAGGPSYGPFPPCGRPKGHDAKGGKGGQWGKGHSEKPSDDDPPVKEWIQKWVAV